MLVNSINIRENCVFLSIFNAIIRLSYYRIQFNFFELFYVESYLNLM